MSYCFGVVLPFCNMQLHIVTVLLEQIDYIDKTW